MFNPNYKEAHFSLTSMVLSHAETLTAHNGIPPAQYNGGKSFWFWCLTLSVWIFTKKSKQGFMQHVEGRV